MGPEHVDNYKIENQTDNREDQNNVNRYAGGLTGGDYLMPVNITWLSDLEHKTPGYIIRVLLKNRHDFRKALNINDASSIQTLLRVLTKAISCDAMSEQLNELISILKTSNFFDNSVKYFMVVPSDASHQLGIEFVNAMKDMIALISNIIVRTPNAITQFVGMHTCLQDAINSLRETSAVIDEQLLTSFTQFTDQKDKAVTRLCRNSTSDSEQQHRNDKEEPPSDFREIGIFPQITDICTDEEPFLRVNKAKGAYDDVDHYLDVQFRLLREDFIGPLRNGVAEYLQNQHGLRRSRRIQDIRIYNNVRIIRPKCCDHGLSYVLQLDKSQLGKDGLESSKQLIYGSLVCLSPDNFRTLYFATVQDREPKEIRFGRLLVKFQHDHLVVKALTGRSLIMAETTAYFESYRHVLLALQSTATNELPFEKYIVKCECQVNVPSYLASHSDFDIRPLVDDNFFLKTHSILGIEYQDRQTLTNAHEKDGLCEIATNRVMVDILERDDWPSASRLHMDVSQLNAIYTALTNEFVITQGPPGTGKTYIGLKIVKTLLHNKLNWSKHPVTGAPDHRPMLIVCYTNHALDQFLEGIVAFYRGDILRIGGRSKSTLLENCNLRNVRQCVRKKYRTYGKVKATKIPGVSARIVENRRLTKRYLLELSKQIDRISSNVKGASFRILNETILREYMKHAYERLVQPFNQWYDEYMVHHGSEYKFDFIILEWLGLGNVELVQPVIDNVNATKCHTREELIEVIDDADSRILDVDDTDDDTNADGDDDTIAKTNVPSAFQEEHIYVNTEHQQHNILHRWQSANDKKKARNHMRHRMASSEVMTEDEIDGIRDLWRINIDDRWKMYRRWVQTYCQDNLNRIAKMEDGFDAAAARYQQALREEDAQLMKVATVIGMTTTGAARYHSVLKEIRPRIVVVEEAAEVYEAHIMTTLTKGCDHLIMIGDHKQLKPSPTVYKLATDYNLDISLFERMVRNGMPCDCLVLQHRMRPEISCFMDHIYDNIRDHEDVKKYENIKGISKNIYCVDHTVPETHNTDTRSHVNEYEVEYIVSLCKYLLLQGYAASQITILTMYSGQLFCLRECMPIAEFDGILVTTVDNYQGEENDIILLSLVRSNSGGYIGFLKIENRVCVALSRAKKGMYIVGNFDCMSKQSDLWKAIRKDIQQKGLIGEGLHLYCQNHPTDDGIYAIKKADFARAPEGGCKKNCDFRLQCGHVCRRKCHVIDSEHVEYKCMEDCLTRCAVNHRCQKRCHEECGTCPVAVSKVIPRCGHTQQIECGINSADFICLAVCPTVLECGHQCTSCCGEKHTTECEVMVERTWSCGHKKMVKCYQKNNTADCDYPCNKLIACGHKCSGDCTMCFQGRLHRSCQEKCNRLLVCGHECEDKCGSCKPCQRKCENECIHRKCLLPCGEACMPCMQPCSWRCMHHACDKMCWEPCSRQRCDAPCDHTLTCGHQCIGLCGEPCPRECRICDAEKVSTLCGNIDIQEARFILLQDCNHIVEHRALGQYMNAILDDEGTHEVKVKVCPRCSTAIRKCSRYGYRINTILHGIEVVKKYMFGSTDTRRELKTSILDELEYIELSYVGTDHSKLTSVITWYREYIKTKQGISERELRLKLIAIQLIALPLNIEYNFERASSQSKVIGPHNLLTDVLNWATDERGSMSAHVLNDAEQEIKRIVTRSTMLVCQFQINIGALDEDMRVALKFADKVLAGEAKLVGEADWLVKQTLEKLRRLSHIPDVSSCIDRAFRSIVAVNVTTGNWRQCKNGHVYEVGDECVGRHDGPKCQTCEDAKTDSRRRKLVETRHKDVYFWRHEHGRDRYAGTTHTTREKKNEIDLKFQGEQKENCNSQTMQRTQRKSINEARSHSHDNQRTTDDGRTDAMSQSQHDRSSMDDARHDTKRNGDENRMMMGKAAFGSKRHVTDGTKQTYPIDANREHNKNKTFKKAVSNRGEPTRETAYELTQDPRRNVNTNSGANGTSRNKASRQTEAKWKTTGEIGRNPRRCVEVGRETTSMGSEVGRNTKDKIANGSGRRTEYNRDTKDEAANESGRRAEYNRYTKDEAANVSRRRTEYNRDTKDNAVNVLGRRVEYNRDTKDKAAKGSESRKYYNRDKKDDATNLSGRRAEYKRDTKDEAVNGSGRREDYNRDIKDEAANGSGRRAEHNQDTKDEAVNGSGRREDYNRDTKDEAANGSGRRAEYNRDVNDEAANGLGRQAAYNSDTKDQATNGSGRPTEYHRDTKDKAANGSELRAEHKRDTEDKAANGLGRRTEYNRDTEDKAADGSGRRTEYNRDTEDKAADGSGRRTEYNRDTNDKATNGAERRAEYNRDAKNNVSNGSGRRAEYIRETKDKAANGSGRRAEYNRDTTDKAANGSGCRAQYNRDTTDKAANGTGRRAEYNRDTGDKVANASGRLAEYNRDTTDNVANGSGRRAEYNGDTKDKAANMSGHRAEYNGDTKDKAANGSGCRAEYNGDTTDNVANGSGRRAEHNGDTKDKAANMSGSRAEYNGHTKDKAANGSGRRAEYNRDATDNFANRSGRQDEYKGDTKDKAVNMSGRRAEYNGDTKDKAGNGSGRRAEYNRDITDNVANGSGRRAEQNQDTDDEAVNVSEHRAEHNFDTKDEAANVLGYRTEYIHDTKDKAANVSGRRTEYNRDTKDNAGNGSGRWTDYNQITKDKAANMSGRRNEYTRDTKDKASNMSRRRTEYTRDTKDKAANGSGRPAEYKRDTTDNVANESGRRAEYNPDTKDNVPNGSGRRAEYNRDTTDNVANGSGPGAEYNRHTKDKAANGLELRGEYNRGTKDMAANGSGRRAENNRGTKDMAAKGSGRKAEYNRDTKDKAVNGLGRREEYNRDKKDDAANGSGRREKHNQDTKDEAANVLVRRTEHNRDTKDEAAYESVRQAEHNQDTKYEAVNGSGHRAEYNRDAKNEVGNGSGRPAEHNVDTKDEAANVSGYQAEHNCDANEETVNGSGRRAEHNRDTNDKAANVSGRRAQYNRNTKDNIANGSGRRAEYNIDTKDKAANGLGRQGEYNRDTMDMAANGSGRKAEYNRDTKYKAVNDSGRRAEYNRDIKDDAANGSGRREKHNEDTKYEAANVSVRRTEHNRATNDEAAYGSVRRAEHNQDTKYEAENGSGYRAEYNRDTKNEAANGSGRRAEHNEDTKDEAAKVSGYQAEHNRDANEEAVNGLGRRAEHNRDINDKAANVSGRRAEYNRNTKDNAGNGSGRRKDYNRYTKDKATNMLGRRVEYNRDTKDNVANASGRKTEYNRDTKNSAARWSGRRAEYNQDTKDKASNGSGRQAEYNGETKDNVANGRGRQAEYVANRSERRAEYNRDTKDNVANGSGRRVEYNRDTTENVANGSGHRTEYNRDTKDKAESGSGRRAEYKRDTKDVAANGSARMTEYNPDTKDDAAIGSGRMAVYNQDTKDQCAKVSERNTEYN